MPNFLSSLAGSPDRPHVLVNERNAACVATAVHAALDARTRRRGLLGRSALEPSEALVLSPCNSIHTFFMRFPIDVLFVRADGRVVKVSPAVDAWRIRWSVRARAVVELAAGAAAEADVRAGDSLRLVAAP